MGSAKSICCALVYYLCRKRANGREFRVLSGVEY